MGWSGKRQNVDQGVKSAMWLEKEWKIQLKYRLVPEYGEQWESGCKMWTLMTQSYLQTGCQQEDALLLMQCPPIVRDVSADTGSVRSEPSEVFCPMLWKAGLDDLRVWCRGAWNVGLRTWIWDQICPLPPLWSYCDLHEPCFVIYKMSMIVPTSQSDWTFRVCAKWESAKSRVQYSY